MRGTDGTSYYCTVEVHSVPPDIFLFERKGADGLFLTELTMAIETILGDGVAVGIDVGNDQSKFKIGDTIWATVRVGGSEAGKVHQSKMTDLGLVCAEIIQDHIITPVNNAGRLKRDGMTACSNAFVTVDSARYPHYPQVVTPIECGVPAQQ